MRHQGKITDWKDDKGFGFVTPDNAGPRVFVHIKSFSNRQRRPVGNELVTYELTSDAGGRPQGVDIAFVGDRPTPPAKAAPGPGIGALIFASTFLAFLIEADYSGSLPFAVPIVYALASCVAYLAYYFDKAAALEGNWRTPESTLHFFGLVGGWPGAMLAQKMLRHKTQKKSFQIVYWVTVVLNCAALGWLLSPTGMHTVNSFVGAARKLIMSGTG